MNTITLTIAATPDNLKRLAEAFGDCIDETLAADDIPAKRKAASPEDPKPEKVKAAEITPEDTEPKEEPATDLTMSDLRAKAAELAKEGHGSDIKALLKEFDAPKVPDLPQESWADFYKRLEEIK